jgi:phosphate transport system ATP-binding protein
MEKRVKIRTEAVTFCFSDQPVFENLSLSLPENSIIAVTGPSGAGKSTFLSLFNRLWEERGGGKMQGRISVTFTDKTVDIYNGDLSVPRLRRRIGMVFQAPNPLPMSIYKNVAFPLKITGKYGKREIAEKVEEMLVRVRLFDEVKDRMRSDARILSGGQQQRLCIARALMPEPEILLLDEPTSSLDGKAAEKIEELLVSLRSSRTLLLVSHYQDQIHRIADCIYTLTDGQFYRTG